MEKHTQTSIRYTVERKNMKNLRIRITGDQRVCVSAPLRLAQSRIDAFVAANEATIRKRLDEIEQKRRRCYPLRYQSGDTFCFCGARYPLRVVNDRRAFAGMDNGELVICVPPGAEVKQLFARWMTREAKALFLARLAAVSPRFDGMPESLPVSVRHMLTRWGSINVKRKTLSLSVHLARCEQELIDYVIMHELCHLISPRHDAAFYRALDTRCLNRKALDKRLSEYGLVDF